MNHEFLYRRRVAFSETDMMGVVHHSNHIKYFEEARVEWLRERGLIDIHVPLGPYTFAVVSAECRYLKPARFDDLLEVRLQARAHGARITFRYVIHSQRIAADIAIGSTELVSLSGDMRPTRLPEHARDIFARETWSEQWP